MAARQSRRPKRGGNSGRGASASRGGSSGRNVTSGGRGGASKGSSGRNNPNRGNAGRGNSGRGGSARGNSGRGSSRGAPPQGGSSSMPIIAGVLGVVVIGGLMMAFSSSPKPKKKKSKPTPVKTTRKKEFPTPTIDPSSAGRRDAQNWKRRMAGRASMNNADLKNEETVHNIADGMSSDHAGKGISIGSPAEAEYIRAFETTILGHPCSKCKK